MTMFDAKGDGLTRMNLRSLPQSRNSFMEEKLCCVYRRIIGFCFVFFFFHFGFLNINQTLNADFYCQQLQCVHENLSRKHLALMKRYVVFLDDNERFSKYVCVCSCREKKLVLGWSVLPSPSVFTRPGIE